jgi:DNA alkylation repair enzyme
LEVPHTMNQVGEAKLKEWLLLQIDSYRDREYANDIRGQYSYSGDVLGIRIDDLRRIASEANEVLKPEPIIWSRFLSIVFPLHHRELILLGIFGLGKGIVELDDLVGERSGGWGRELENIEVTDFLAEMIGFWILDDLSRMGYLEAWVVKGENIFKKRLAVVATVTINSYETKQVTETHKILRHLMETEDDILLKAQSVAIRMINEKESTIKFLAWWAPRISEKLLNDCTLNLSVDIRQQLIDLVK